MIVKPSGEDKKSGFLFDDDIKYGNHRKIYNYDVPLFTEL